MLFLMIHLLQMESIGSEITDASCAAGAWNLVHTVGESMVNHHELFALAVKYSADVTPSRQIIWEPSGIFTGKWTQSLQFRPSVLDCVVLEKAPHVVRYRDALLTATGWQLETYYGFQQIMLMGRLIEDEKMYRTGLPYWKGIINGLLFIEMYKTNWSQR